MPFDGSLSERLPTTDEVEKAKKAARMLASMASKQGALTLRLNQGKRYELVELPPAISQLMLDLLILIGKGEAVTLVSVGAELTTQQAADLLNVSRPFLIKLIEEKQLPHHKVGRHRRIRAEDLFEYKRRRDHDRSEALDKLARLGQEIDAG
jgi:excisionase family DNA binding protein